MATLPPDSTTRWRLLTLSTAWTAACAIACALVWLVPAWTDWLVLPVGLSALLLVLWVAGLWKGIDWALQPLHTTLQTWQAQHQSMHDEQASFLANASHQLRTPFAVLRTQVQGLLSGELQADNTLPQMLLTVNRSHQLVHQLLARARIDQLSQRADWQTCDLELIARDIAIEFAPLLGRKQLDFSLQATSIPVQSDRWLLGELLRNLLSNAIQHSPEGAALGIVIRRLPSGPELLVWDNGGGLDASVQTRLFEPFQTASGPQGVGLGLSICKQIAQSMDAQIGLYNRIQNDRVVGVDAVVRWSQPHD